MGHRISADDLAQELFYTFVGRILEEMIWCTFLNDLSVCHKYHTVRYLSGKSHLVGNDHHGDIFLCQLDHDIQYFLNRLGIQCRSRLIEEDDLRLRTQGSRYGNSLLLSTGKRCGIYMCLIP